MPACRALLDAHPRGAVLQRGPRSSRRNCAQRFPSGLHSGIEPASRASPSCRSAIANRPRRPSGRYSLRPVINATGVILHTNLGRAPLSDAALRHVVEVAQDYCNLEFDLETGLRSRRDVAR